jgi:hypothetical protein
MHSTFIVPVAGFGFNSKMKICAKTKMFKEGYMYAMADAKIGVTPDDVGSCDANENLTSAKNLRMSGYDIGHGHGCQIFAS